MNEKRNRSSLPTSPNFVGHCCRTSFHDFPTSCRVDMVHLTQWAFPEQCGRRHVLGFSPHQSGLSLRRGWGARLRPRRHVKGSRCIQKGRFLPFVSYNVFWTPRLLEFPDHRVCRPIFCFCPRQATELAPQLSDAYTYLGNALSELGSFEEARDVYQKAIKQTLKKGDGEKAAMLHFHLAGAQSSLGHTDKAIKSYKVRACAP